jgi:hypothetical protein
LSSAPGRIVSGGAAIGAEPQFGINKDGFGAIAWRAIPHYHLGPELDAEALQDLEDGRLTARILRLMIEPELAAFAGLAAFRTGGE